MKSVLSIPKRGRAVSLIAVGVLVASAALSGCASSSAPEAASGSSSDAEAAAASATANMEKWYAGTDRELPTASPTPVKNANVWIISCGQTAEGCASGARGAMDAGKALGWKMTLVDGKFTPQVWNAGIRQAIADKADAVLLDIVDCGPVKASLDEARKAGVKIYGAYSFDCTDDSASEKPRFDAEVNYGNDFPTFGEYIQGYGASMADYIIAQTDGKAKTIEFTHNELKVVKYIVKGFDARLADCKSCETLAVQDITLADLGTTLQQKAATLLSRFPQANAVFGMYDSAISLGIGAAVMASNRHDDLVVTGGEGFAANAGLIRDNKGQNFFAGSPSTWTGWASVDGINRMLAGEDQVDAGIGFRSADKDHNLPATNVSYDGTKDYKSNYLKIWGLK
ncbi:hypothetical protein BH09ACT10_BH09ACT10_25400 [soil metagenome]